MYKKKIHFSLRLTETTHFQKLEIKLKSIFAVTGHYSIQFTA